MMKKEARMKQLINRTKSLELELEYQLYNYTHNQEELRNKLKNNQLEMVDITHEQKYLGTSRITKLNGNLKESLALIEKDIEVQDKSMAIMLVIQDDIHAIVREMQAVNFLQ